MGEEQIIEYPINFLSLPSTFSSHFSLFHYLHFSPPLGLIFGHFPSSLNCLSLLSIAVHLNHLFEFQLSLWASQNIQNSETYSNKVFKPVFTTLQNAGYILSVAE